MRSEIPSDCSRSLDYASTVETLKLLEGEELCRFIPGGAGEAASRIQVKGVLRHYAYGWAEGFALGDAARVLLSEPNFVSAHLSAYDGVEFLRISLDLADISFFIGDRGVLETDEFAFP
jgi:hypothetical protein